MTDVCPEFHAQSACAFGDDCPFLHVHRFKSAFKSPNAPGHVIGAERDEDFANIVLEVLAEFPGMEPRDVRDVVQKRLLLLGAPKRV
jgi:hypothetical protein